MTTEQKLLAEWMQQIADAAQSNFSDAKSLTRRDQPPRISIRGQRFSLADDEGLRPLATGDKLRFVVLKLKKPRARFLYPMPYDPRKPFRCYSLDAITSEPDSSERQTEFCKECPKGIWTQTSTGQNIRPECGEKKQLSVFIPGQTGAWLFSIPVGSLRKQWDPYVDEIENKFVAHRALDGRSHINLATIITEASFIVGQQSVLSFKAVGWIDDLPEQDRAEFQKLFRDQELHTNLLWGSKEREEQYRKSLNQVLEARPFAGKTTEELINDTIPDHPAPPKTSRRRSGETPNENSSAQAKELLTEMGYDFEL